MARSSSSALSHPAVSPAASALRAWASKAKAPCALEPSPLFSVPHWQSSSEWARDAAWRPVLSGAAPPLPAWASMRASTEPGPGRSSRARAGKRRKKLETPSQRVSQGLEREGSWPLSLASHSTILLNLCRAWQVDVRPSTWNAPHLPMLPCCTSYPVCSRIRHLESHPPHCIGR